LMILLNTIEGNWSLKEGVILNIPVGVVMGSNCEAIQGSIYPIPAGNDTAEGSILYANLFKNAVLKGWIKEKIKIIPLIIK
jgi:ribosomal protein S2